jgi:RNA polymerase sigma factor (sigma-70 family)
MSMPQEPIVSEVVHKLQPSSKLPTAAVLKSLSQADLRLLETCLEESAEYLFDESFAQPGAEARFLAPLPEPKPRARRRSADAFDGPAVRAWDSEHERDYFLKLNYCRFRVFQVLQAAAANRLTADQARELLRWGKIVQRLRGDIVAANMPLVLAMAKRTRIHGVDYAELISEGNLALLRSVDKFDPNRGFKFSTYACRAILKSFSRVATRTSRYRGYFPTEFDPTLERSDFVDQKREQTEEACVDELRSIIGRNLASLSATEERVIRARFAIGEEAGSPGDRIKGKTLEQVGELIGVTKERVRQIQNKALNKLRTVLETGILAS